MLKNLASTLDYEAAARDILNETAFNYFADKSASQPADIEHFEKIKLKLRGMANLKHFEGLGTTILGHKVDSPICVGPLMNERDMDVLFRLGGKKPAGGAAVNEIVMKDCNELKQLYCHRESEDPDTFSAQGLALVLISPDVNG